MWIRATRFVNCVKIRRSFDTSYKPKAYNKVAETMQQRAVRDKEVSCKFDRRVAPSTKGLKGKIYDPDYNNHGITLGRHIEKKCTGNSVRVHK